MLDVRFWISKTGYNFTQNPVSNYGGPCENRTHDQRIKSPLLYQTELTAQPKSVY